MSDQQQPQQQVSTETQIILDKLKEIQDMIIPQGWKCPECGRIHSPEVNTCDCKSEETIMCSLCYTKLKRKDSFDQISYVCGHCAPRM